MLIFNTTYKVSGSIADSWIEWIQKHHIPFMLNSNQFSKPQISKIVGSEDEEGISYSVQFHISDMETLINWHQNNAARFQNDSAENFGNNVQFFSTVLEIIE